MLSADKWSAEPSDGSAKGSEKRENVNSFCLAKNLGIARHIRDPREGPGGGGDFMSDLSCRPLLRLSFSSGTRRRNATVVNLASAASGE